MDTNKTHPHPRIESIHNPHLHGEATLLVPEGLLVRWPERVTMPDIGAEFTGTVVSVPREVRETVLTLLFDPCALARCDAAKRLGDNKRHRHRILDRLFSRTYVQKMLASAERLRPEQRERMKAQGECVPVRRLFEAASMSGPGPGEEGRSQVATISPPNTCFRREKSAKKGPINV